MVRLPPMTERPEVAQESVPEQVMVPVATEPKVLGVPAPVHMARYPILGTEEVETAAVMVGLVPPTKAPKTPPRMMPPPAVTEVVATLATPLADEKYRRLPIEPAEEVARPDQPREPEEPMTLKEPFKGVAGVTVEVATLAKVLAEEKYGM